MSKLPTPQHDYKPLGHRSKEIDAAFRKEGGINLEIPRWFLPGDTTGELVRLELENEEYIKSILEKENAPKDKCIIFNLI